MRDLEDHYWWFVARRAVALKWLFKHLDQKDQPTVLDLGCGTGALMSDLKDQANVVGLDFSELALQLSYERGFQNLIQGDGAKLPLASESFDAVIGLDVFEHIEDDDSALQEAKRILKPGGLLVLSVPAFSWLWGPHDVALHHFRRYRRVEMDQKLVSAGFSIERSSYSIFLLFALVLVSRLLEKLKRGAPKASLPMVGSGLNKFLLGLQNIESWMLDRVHLPFGSSVLVVARRDRMWIK